MEINKLEKAGIIEDVTNTPTPWLNPLVCVPKSDGGIRLCVDMRCANKAVKRTRYPTPTIDDLKAKLKGAILFSKLDMRSAFHQLELSRDSRYITAFQSDTKIKQFTRLIFGINSASEELQHVIRALLSDIPNVINIADDILIYAKNQGEHDEALTRVLNRFKEKNLTLNIAKCELGKESLTFFGHVFTKEGMKPNPEKIKEIRNTPKPENVKALRSFLGLTNYMKAYIKDYSTLTHPLRELLRNDVEWSWNEQCEKAFQSLKTILTSETIISYFDNTKETFLFTDASPFGISAILLQKSPGKDDTKIITYSSRALTKAESNYAQIERECLSVVYGCERNRLYLIGREFEIFTDHKALVNIMNNPKATVPLRIERLTLRLQGYNFIVKYVKSDENISDYSSRHPHEKPDLEPGNSTEQYINHISEYAKPNAITMEDIKRETKKDKICQKIIQFTKSNRWKTLENETDLTDEEINLLKHYRKIKEQLTISIEED